MGLPSGSSSSSGSSTPTTTSSTPPPSDRRVAVAGEGHMMLPYPSRGVMGGTGPGVTNGHDMITGWQYLREQ